MDGTFSPPTPTNEAVRAYAPGSAERNSLAATLSSMAADVAELPCRIGDRWVETGRRVDITMPTDHRHVLGHAHYADAGLVNEAISSCVEARLEWAAMPWAERASVFLRAAALLAGPWRDRLNASTMLGQGKTCHQAEIDAACELIDFLRFNVAYAAEIYADQPPVSPRGIWNRLDWRGLEGFVFAVTPFNFTSIAGNLPTAPALMGNAVLWKPARTQAHSAQVLMELFVEAGLPPGVINLVHGAGAEVGGVALPHPELSGVHFTGGTGTFNHIWKTVGDNLGTYRSYPRLVGETGGKDFIVAHASADVQALSVAIARGSFEYQGQKCSASSRLYIPKSLWPEVRSRVSAMVAEMKVGDVRELDTFIAAVIDQKSFSTQRDAIELGRRTGEIVFGGGCDDSEGWFVEPTMVRVDDPRHHLMATELFGPVVTAFVYDDGDWDELLPIVDSTSPYALTGAVFARDRRVINQALVALRNAAGNFYINDKPTGAVVGQQPFGGGRGSGTNDKAGAKNNLLRWCSPHTIKENFNPPRNWRYPYLG